MHSPKNTATHLYTIDLMRGVAALGVCIYHFATALLPEARINAIVPLAQTGSNGVALFFVISGFIIPYVLLNSGYTTSANFTSFICKRMVRLALPAYVAMGLFLTFWLGYEQLYGHAHPMMGHFTITTLLANITFTGPIIHEPWITSILWTLSIEFQYYLITGLLLNTIFRSRGWFIAIGAIIVALGFIPVPFIEYYCYWSPLFLMGGAALMFLNQQFSPAQLVMVILALALITALHIDIPTAIAGLMATTAILFLKINTRIGAFLGKISFSLYLIHPLCGVIFGKYLVMFIKPASTISKLGIQFCCLALTIGTAYLFYLTVDKFFITLSKKIGFKN